LATVTAATGRLIGPFPWLSLLQATDFYISECELQNIMKTASSKSCLLDPWPTNCLDYLIKPITGIINKCLVEGCFPDRLKKAIVTPLIKEINTPKGGIHELLGGQAAQ
jgi:hypothetical protein